MGLCSREQLCFAGRTGMAGRLEVFFSGAVGVLGIEEPLQKKAL